ncbi:MAG: hypothetical protein MAG431_00606 [Chloroflexi bacterium]|nr:hypothetical protein [Chloroflexota bacterium]
MPIYEYQCQNCQEDFEIFVRSFSQEYTPICPKCESGDVKKCISLFAGSSGDCDDCTVTSCPTGAT